jgi:hypothetical protein
MTLVMTLNILAGAAIANIVLLCILATLLVIGLARK